MDQWSGLQYQWWRANAVIVRHDRFSAPKPVEIMMARFGNCAQTNDEI